MTRNRNRLTACAGLIAGMTSLATVSGCTMNTGSLAHGDNVGETFASGGVIDPSAELMADSSMAGKMIVDDGNGGIMIVAAGTPHQTIAGMAPQMSEGLSPQLSGAMPSGNYVTGVPSGMMLANHSAMQSPFATDVATAAYMKRGPSVTGQQLGLKPGETASEKALEFKKELSESAKREADLKARVAELEVQIDQKNQRLVEAIEEMNVTRQELISVRGQLERWSGNMNDLKEKIRSAEADNLATMQTIINLLQQFLQVDSDLQNRSRQKLDLEKLLESQGQGAGQ